MSKIFALLLLIPSMLLASPATAEKQSQAAIITTEITNSHPVVGQKVTLNYQLAVEGYFNGATSFQLPSLSKARLVQSSSFAINGSTSIEGEKYATQLWQIELYPEHAGLLELPALSFKVQYMDSSGNEQNKTLRSDNVALFAYLPKALQQIEEYIVSSDVQITDSWSDAKDSYQVGDIIQREITITAADIKSIQMPRLKLHAIDGVQKNTQEPKLDDQYNRGEQTATINQTITYVLQHPGNYQIGGEKLYWWHPKEGLQQVIFEPITLKVDGVSPLTLQLLMILLLFILLVIFTFFKCKNRPRSLTVKLKQALKQQKWQQLIDLLYQKADQKHDLGLLKQGTQAQTGASLLAARYNQSIKSPQQANISKSHLKNLIK